MKKPKRSVTLFLTAALMSASLLQLAGCGYKEPENPFDPIMTMPFLNADDPENSSGGLSIGRYFGESDYDPTAVHGEKKLYSDQINTNVKTLYNGEMMFDWINTSNIATYSLSEPLKRSFLCFDPTCEHLRVETCTSTLTSSWEKKDPNDITSDMVYYGVQVVVDSYDYEDVPVLYMSFRRDSIYYVNGVMHEREAVYCIERFDMNTGKRTVVADYVQETIDKLFTYGDYVYFTMTAADDSRSLCRVSKAGGDIETLGEPQFVTYEILDVVDDQLYYLIDGRYLNRCSLALTDNEQILDTTTLTGVDGESRAIIDSARGGYLYYRADTEKVKGKLIGSEKESELGSKCNLFRIPLNAPTAEPELLAENITTSFIFTDDTVFYMPAVYEPVDVVSSWETYMHPVNETNGTMYALDLNTLEVTTVCENTGLIFYFRHVISCEDDMIAVTTQPYSYDAAALSNNGDNVLWGRKSGGGLELYYQTGPYEYENKTE